jgi:hypothetical protein
MNLQIRETDIAEEGDSGGLQRDQGISVEVGITKRLCRDCICAFAVIPLMHVLT